jgi:hypothetical protein
LFTNSLGANAPETGTGLVVFIGITIIGGGADGIDLGENQDVLLKKIDELTFYIIEQSKPLEAVETELKQLKKK